MGSVSRSNITRILIPVDREDHRLSKWIQELTWNPVDGPERPEDSDCSYGGEVQLLDI